MKKKCTILFFGVLTVSLMANETFNGIGISVIPSSDGVLVNEVIPGTPASESKILMGDEIIAVDGESLKGKTIWESVEKLRGQRNKPLEITFVSNGDTLSTTIRRTQITVKKLDSEGIEAWYGNKAEFNNWELEHYANETENSKRLVAVLHNGSLVRSGESIAAKSLDGIYVEKDDESIPKLESANLIKSSSVIVVGLNRMVVMFELKCAGRAVVSIMDADGAVVAKLVSEDAQPGLNSLKWNSQNVPSGRYMVTIEHNGSVGGKNVVLK